MEKLLVQVFVNGKTTCPGFCHWKNYLSRFLSMEKLLVQVFVNGKTTCPGFCQWKNYLSRFFLLRLIERPDFLSCFPLASQPGFAQGKLTSGSAVIMTGENFSVPHNHRRKTTNIVAFFSVRHGRNFSPGLTQPSRLSVSEGNNRMEKEKKMKLFFIFLFF